MTTIESPAQARQLIDSVTPVVALDLYRDIHKGIRADLFAVTLLAGQTDPEDRHALADLASYLHSVVETLEDHAHHEDVHIQPAIEEHIPRLAASVSADHARFERRTGRLLARAFDLKEAAEGDRDPLHALYLDLAQFSTAYLRHQDTEEREIMPALDAAIGFDEVLAIHQAIVSSIPPDQMHRSLAFMLPAMNIDDRAELLGGIRAAAPAEVFGGVWGLAASVLAPIDRAALAARLDIG